MASVYLNGALIVQYGGGMDSVTHQQVSDSAYTEFTVRIDNATNVTWGPTSSPNVLAVHVDGSYGTEHWYAGAGLYRSVHLEHTALMHLDAGLLYFPAVVQLNDSTAAGETALATLQPSVGVTNDSTAGGAALGVTVAVQLMDATGSQIGAQVTTNTTAKPGGVTTLVMPPSLVVRNATLWSIQNPYVYTIQMRVSETKTGLLLDAVNTTVGVRVARFDAQKGFFLNGQNVKLRGFCHHDDFTGVGMAMPDRAWLLRAMQSRGVGANSLRTSHNNYRTAVYCKLQSICQLSSNFSIESADSMENCP